MDLNLQIPRVSLKKIIFSDGSQVQLSDNQILVIVGANNSGKSATLKEINDISKFEHLPLNRNKVVKDAEFTRYGSVNDLMQFIFRNTFTRPENGDVRHVSVYDENNNSTSTVPVDLNEIRFRWEHPSKLSYIFSHFFVNHLTTSRRLWASMPAPPIGVHFKLSLCRHCIVEGFDLLSDQFPSVAHKASA